MSWKKNEAVMSFNEFVICVSENLISRSGTNRGALSPMKYARSVSSSRKAPKPRGGMHQQTSLRPGEVEPPEVRNPQRTTSTEATSLITKKYAGRTPNRRTDQLANKPRLKLNVWPSNPTSACFHF